MNDLISRAAAIARMKEMVGCAKCDNYNYVRCRVCNWGDAMNIVEEAPAVNAIPVEWLDWRIMNAKYNGIKEAADAFEFVLKCWKEQETK